jgi:alpha,alpha-trehalase
MQQGSLRAVQDSSSLSAFPAIADYGMLADCHSAAHVDLNGSIDWLCLPRYDSSALFARILDPDAGHWSIRPAEPFTSTRRYLPGTLVIETTFTTDSGVVRLTDALAVKAQSGHDLGIDAPHEVLRDVQNVSGEVEMLLELAPRPEYGLVRPLFRRTPEGGRTFGSCQIAVASGVPVEIEASTMRAAFVLSERDGVGFSLRWGPVEASQIEATPPQAVRDRIADTARAWRSWEAEHDIYDGPHKDLV